MFSSTALAKGEHDSIDYNDVFDGYNGLEITEKGRVGYNCTISLPNGETIAFGFDPRESSNQKEVSSAYAIASGWNFKMSFIEKNNNKVIVHTKQGRNIILDANQSIESLPRYVLSEENVTLQFPYDETYKYNKLGYLEEICNTFGERIKSQIVK